MYRVHAYSRLHFGLLRLPGGPMQQDGRHFGGIGLMIRQPGICLTAEPAPSWAAAGPLAERALAYARQFAVALSIEDRPCRLAIEHGAPEHAGLGTGTQLGLAVAGVLARVWGRGDMDAHELARHIARGKRSALGIHGFARGGFLVDGGKGPLTAIAPLIARLDFPEDWHIVLVLRQGGQGLSGVSESQAFDRLQAEDQRTESLCRLVLLGILPALVEHDLPAFSEAIYEFNRQVGEMFRPFQGGIYADARSDAVIDFFRRHEIAGAGQSSWGPAVFAVVEQARAGQLATAIRKHFGLGAEEVIVTQAANQGAEVACVSPSDD
jgi:beta-ribofuranosylaminobenzene 5'-phosphate synthase